MLFLGAVYDWYSVCGIGAVGLWVLIVLCVHGLDGWLLFVVVSGFADYLFSVCVFFSLCVCCGFKVFGAGVKFSYIGCVEFKLFLGIA